MAVRAKKIIWIPILMVSLFLSACAGIESNAPSSAEVRFSDALPKFKATCVASAAQEIYPVEGVVLSIDGELIYKGNSRRGVSRILMREQSGEITVLGEAKVCMPLSPEWRVENEVLVLHSAVSSKSVVIDFSLKTMHVEDFVDIENRYKSLAIEKLPETYSPVFLFDGLGKLVRETHDVNEDGNPEYEARYNAKTSSTDFLYWLNGAKSRLELDENNDGWLDVVDIQHRRFLVKSSYDLVAKNSEVETLPSGIRFSYAYWKNNTLVARVAYSIEGLDTGEVSEKVRVEVISKGGAVTAYRTSAYLDAERSTGGTASGGALSPKMLAFIKSASNKVSMGEELTDTQIMGYSRTLNKKRWGRARFSVPLSTSIINTSEPLYFNLVLNRFVPSKEHAHISLASNNLGQVVIRSLGENGGLQVVRTPLDFLDVSSAPKRMYRKGIATYRNRSVFAIQEPGSLNYGKMLLVAGETEMRNYEPWAIWDLFYAIQPTGATELFK